MNPRMERVQGATWVARDRGVGRESPLSVAPMWSKALEKAVHRGRELYPRWGKEKLVVLVRREGLEASESTVGRIIKSLHKRGLLREPVREKELSAERATLGLEWFFDLGIERHHSVELARRVFALRNSLSVVRRCSRLMVASLGRGHHATIELV